MFKKESLLLVLVSIVGLSGCCKKKAVVETKKSGSAGKIVEMPVAQDSDAIADNNVKSFFDQDINDFVASGSKDFSADEDDTKNSLGDNTTFAFTDSVQDEETFKHVYFDFDKHDIRADQKSAIQENVKKAKVTAKAAGITPTFVVEGHCDEPGSPEYNLALSEKRAKSVANMLAAAGISNVKTIGLGNSRPVVRNAGKDERNRRAEVHVIYS